MGVLWHFDSFIGQIVTATQSQLLVERVIVCFDTRTMKISGALKKNGRMVECCLTYNSLKIPEWRTSNAFNVDRVDTEDSHDIDSMIREIDEECIFPSEKYKMSVFDIAALYNRINVLQAIFGTVSPIQRNKLKRVRSAYWFACKRNSIEAVECLLKHGVPLRGVWPEIVPACSHEMLHCFLQGSKTCINLTNMDGVTALMIECARGMEITVDLLLLFNANATTVDHQGKNALDHAMGHFSGCTTEREMKISINVQRKIERAIELSKEEE